MMMRYILAFAAVGATAGVAGAQRGATQVTKFTVAGIPVIHKRVTANDVIAVQLYLRGGSAALTPATAGVEQFMGDLATHGTRKYTKDRFTAIATSTGTNIGASAGYDFTTFQMQAVRQHWDAAWDLFAQAVRYPTFPADEMEQVRGQIVNDLKQRKDDPDSHLTELADSAFYSGHSYAIDPSGTIESIEKLTRDQLVQWHRRRLTKANLLLVVVGNVTREALRAKITAAFADLPARGGRAGPLARLSEMRPDVLVAKQELPTNYIMGLFRAPAPGDPDFAATRVAVRVLSDRLFEEIRTKRNLTYAVAAGVSSRGANRGNLYVTAVNPDTTIKVMKAEVRRLQTELVPAVLLNETINVFATQYWMAQQTNMGQASQLGLWELLGGGWANAIRYVDRLRAVSPEEVRRVAQLYLKNVRFAVIGDPSKIDRTLFTSM